MLVLRDNVAVIVREGKINKIVSLKDYVYTGRDVINGRGFGININSNNDIKELLKDYLDIGEDKTKYANFSNK